MEYDRVLGESIFLSGSRAQGGNWHGSKDAIVPTLGAMTSWASIMLLGCRIAQPGLLLSPPLVLTLGLFVGCTATHATPGKVQRRWQENRPKSQVVLVASGLGICSYTSLDGFTLNFWSTLEAANVSHMSCQLVWLFVCP